MGQIVIDIPSKKNRHYLLADADEAEALIDSLDDTAVRLKNPRTGRSKQQIEDLSDGRSADRVVADYERTRESHTVDELRKRFGI